MSSILNFFDSLNLITKCSLVSSKVYQSLKPTSGWGKGVSELLILCQKQLLALMTLLDALAMMTEITLSYAVFLSLSARLVLRCYNISLLERKDIWNH